MTGFRATGIGSLPGDAPDEAQRIVAGELPDLVHLAELPARGPGSDLVGRTMGMLADLAPDLAVETTPAGWRFADAPGRIMRRAQSWLAQDLDAAEQHFAGAPVMKVQVCGPWTLAAAIEMRNGERAVRDPGACRDLAAALADAVDAHIREVRRRLPAAEIVVQVDEPSLPSVLAGGVTTASGLATYRAIDPQVAQGHLAAVIASIHTLDARSWVHCCAAGVPVDLLRRSGVDGISVDATGALGPLDEPLGAAVDAGVTVALGVIDGVVAIDPEPASRRRAGQRAARRVETILGRWGFSADVAGPVVVLTPSCGLAGAHPGSVRPVYAALREAGRLLRDDESMGEVEQVRSERVRGAGGSRG